MPPGLLPKLVTSTNDAADAGGDSATTPTARRMELANPASNLVRLMIPPSGCSFDLS
jgi:hypothetical protein